ncbi:MAG: PQQ-binding-like beta-propeller repeat protein [Rhodospirillaceae bacterium]|nr:PQQ-binding-like beta-propeller repeat protein [Rhodospirillaceae bacterium]MYB13819.1 PQQ-binding-like beta-propeller repeat protein [Rhodospirillaceae bacterium]MYI48470.1 PQQ-binding-like beta-propeller repeat protein [Rhodospirillaceae bacterium]
MSRLKLAVALAAGLATAGCDSIRDIFSTDDPPLPGRRLAVLPTPDILKADVRISDVRIVLPRPAPNAAWPQQAGYPNHAMHHLALGRDPRQAWSVGAGSGSESQGLLSLSRSRRLLAQPVIADARTFAMDSNGTVRGFDLKSGRQLWSQGTLPRHERDGDVGGGIAYHEGQLFVATGAAEVLAMDAASGRVLWRRNTGAPMRSPPAANDGRLFVVTTENTVIAFDTKDGKKLWSHDGVAARTGLLGGGAPAVDEGVVVAPQSTGEVVALRAESGTLVWTENLGAAQRGNPVGGLSAIIASPVIDRGVVYAVSNAGRLAAIELASGRRLWDIELSSRQTVWVAGDYVFVLTNRAVLAAIRRSDGRVRWAIRLDRFTDDDDLAGGRPFWTGPVLAGDRLVVAGSHGEALAVSPYTGEVIGWIPLSRGVFIPPAIAQGTILFLDDSGRLTAMR